MNNAIYRSGNLQNIISLDVNSIEKSEIIFLPNGYANGIKALETNSELMVFSNMGLEESVIEKIRYPSNWWFNWEKY